MRACIRAIEYYLPETVVANEDLADPAAGWTAEKIYAKTGIAQRRIASPGQCSSDLAVAAAERLFASGACNPDQVDYLLLCTQSPDFFLPTTACTLQHRLGLPTRAGALDFNLGCSGYVYGLGLASGLVQTGQAGRVLLITAETYSKFLHSGDRSVRSLFGDAAAATLVEAGESGAVGPFVYGTDGRGADNLIVPVGGMRDRDNPGASSLVRDESGNTRTLANLYMDGPEIFNFTLRTVPALVLALLAKAGLTLEEIDLFVFHQANRYLLDFLQRKIGIEPERFVVFLENCGNTVSSTIPIALKSVMQDGRVRPGARAMLVGFGVGYSWGACLVEF